MNVKDFFYIKADYQAILLLHKQGYRYIKLKGDESLFAVTHITMHRGHTRQSRLGVIPAKYAKQWKRGYAVSIKKLLSKRTLFEVDSKPPTPPKPKAKSDEIQARELVVMGAGIGVGKSQLKESNMEVKTTKKHIVKTRFNGSDVKAVVETGIDHVTIADGSDCVVVPKELIKTLAKLIDD